LNTGKPASQTSKAYNYNGAEKSNDGIYEPIPGVVSLSVTRLEQRPWWRVNLKGVFTVYAVQILNRYNGEQLIQIL